MPARFNKNKKCCAPFKHKPARGSNVKPLGKSIIIKKSDARYKFKSETLMCTNCKDKIYREINTSGKFEWREQQPTGQIDPEEGTSGLNNPEKEASSSEMEENSDSHTDLSVDDCDLDDVNQTLTSHNVLPLKLRKYNKIHIL